MATSIEIIIIIITIIIIVLVMVLEKNIQKDVLDCLGSYSGGRVGYPLITGLAVRSPPPLVYMWKGPWAEHTMGETLVKRCG